MTSNEAPPIAVEGRNTDHTFQNVKADKGTLTNIFKRKPMDSENQTQTEDPAGPMTSIPASNEELPEITPQPAPMEEVKPQEQHEDAEMKEGGEDKAVSAPQEVGNSKIDPSGVPFFAVFLSFAWLNSLLCFFQASNKKRKRAGKTPEQLAALEALFAETTHPCIEAKRQCGSKIGLDLNAVSNWFENRRRRLKTAAAATAAATTAAVEPQADKTEGNSDVDMLATKQENTAPPHLPPSVNSNVAIDASAAPVSPAVAIATTSPIPAPAATETTPAPVTAPAPTATAPLLPPTAKERDELAANFEIEASKLRTHGLLPPLTPLPSTSTYIYNDANLAALVVGQRLPLTQLVAALLPLFTTTTDTTATEPKPTLTGEALRSRIVDIAVRKSHDPADRPKGGTASTPSPLSVDALEAMPTALPSMWQWELKDVKVLESKVHREQAMAIKKRAGKVDARLNAVLAVVAVLQKLLPSSTTAPTATATAAAENKATKLLEAVKKHPRLEEIMAAEEAEKAASALKKRGMSAEEKQRARKEKEEEKERLKREKEEEKERLKREKEEEKERLKKEKAAEKERLKKEKEAEKEQKAKEAELAKLAKKTGFKDKTALSKTSNKFMSFFKAAATSPHPASTPHPHSSTKVGAAAAAGGGISPATQHATAAATHDGAATTTTTITTTTPVVAVLSAYERRFPRPPTDHLVPQPLQPLQHDKIDHGLREKLTFDAVECQWKSRVQTTAKERRQRKTSPPPPSASPLLGLVVPGLKKERENGSAN